MFRHALLFGCLLALVVQVSAADEDQAKKKKKADAPRGNAADFLKRLDKNNDGKLDKSEIPEKMARFFERIDANKDGKLDQKELDQMFQRLRQNAPGKGNPGQFVQRFLERLDGDKDGKISKAEAKGPLEKGFDRLDANKDGFLDKNELGKLAERFANGGDRPRGDAAPDRPAPREDFPFFDGMDRNADGRLTKEEVQGQPKVSQAFAAIDTNKDGKIDPKEYEAFLKTQQKKE